MGAPSFILHHVLTPFLDREDAMKDDYGLEANYTYEDDEEWGDDETDWAGDEEQDEEATDAKDESSAYLKFLNEEVSLLYPGPVYNSG